MLEIQRWRWRLLAALRLWRWQRRPHLRPKGYRASSEFLFVAQLALLMLVGRLLGEVMIRLKQPAVMGQLLAGLALGPSLLGALFPDLQHAIFPAAKEQKAMLEAISQFGVLMLLLLTGMETDLRLVRRTGGISVIVVAHRHHCAVRMWRRTRGSIA